MGRRQQRRRPRARRGRRLRAQHVHDRQDARGGRRGRRDRRLRARQGPRRRALHDLPARCATRSEATRDDAATVARWRDRRRRGARRRRLLVVAGVARDRPPATGSRRDAAVVDDRGSPVADVDAVRVDRGRPLTDDQRRRARGRCRPTPTPTEASADRRQVPVLAAVGLHDPVRADRADGDRDVDHPGRRSTHSTRTAQPIPGTYQEVEPTSAADHRRLARWRRSTACTASRDAERRATSTSSTAASCSARSTWPCSSSSSAASSASR